MPFTIECLTNVSRASQGGLRGASVSKRCHDIPQIKSLARGFPLYTLGFKMLQGTASLAWWLGAGAVLGAALPFRQPHAQMGLSD